MRRLRMNISFLGRLGLVPLGITAWIGLAATAMGAAPPNDNFANAIAIPVGFNDWGTVNGTNASATAEPGEPAARGHCRRQLGLVFAGPPRRMGRSISTRSTAPSPRGWRFIPARSSPTSAWWRPATLMPLPPASQPRQSNGNLGGVRFRASAGTTYYIAVDTQAGTAGPFVLNWAYHSSGLFRFSFGGLHLRRNRDQLTEPGDVRAHSVPGLVITITRLFGSDGRVAVNYTTTTNVTVPSTAMPVFPARTTRQFRPARLRESGDEPQLCRAHYLRWWPAAAGPCFRGDPD